MLGKASEIKTKAVVCYPINNGMSTVAMDVVVNDFFKHHPDKIILDIKPTETFALIIYKEGESS